MVSLVQFCFFFLPLSTRRHLRGIIFKTFNKLICCFCLSKEACRSIPLADLHLSKENSAKLDVEKTRDIVCDSELERSERHHPSRGLLSLASHGMLASIQPSQRYMKLCDFDTSAPRTPGDT